MLTISLTKDVAYFLLTRNAVSMWITVTLLNGHVQILSCVS